MLMRDKTVQSPARPQRRSRARNLALSLACLLSLQACTTFEQVDRSIAGNRQDADQQIGRINNARQTGAVIRHTGQKIAGAEVLTKPSELLPAVFDEPFSYLSAFLPLSDILSEVGRRTGLRVAIQPLGAKTDGGGSIDTGGSNSIMASALTPPVLSGISTPTSGVAKSSVPIALDWNGSLRGLLDYLALRSNMHWKLVDGRIYFYHTETRNFNVYLPSGKRSVNSSISLSGAKGAAGSGGGDTKGGTVDVSSEMEVDAYKAIVQTVTAMVAADRGERAGDGSSKGGEGSKEASSADVIANSALGIITVTAGPQTLDRVEEYLRGVNERFAQNVLIGVKIYNLTVKKDANVGASLSLAYENVARKYGIGLTGAPPLSPSSGTPGQFVVNALEGSKFAGTSLLVQALEQIGNVSLLTSGQVITANGQPSPLQVANEITYLASSSTSQTANVGATTTLTPGAITVGFTANFLPMILGDNRILLQYQMNMSSLTQLNQVTSGEAMIQTPVVQKHDLQQHAFVRDGQSLVLFGFEQERSASDLSKGLTAFGRNAAGERSMMVIVLEVHSGK